MPAGETNLVEVERFGRPVALGVGDRVGVGVLDGDMNRVVAVVEQPRKTAAIPTTTESAATRENRWLMNPPRHKKQMNRDATSRTGTASNNVARPRASPG